jgi:hypothetical protein
LSGLSCYGRQHAWSLSFTVIVFWDFDCLFMISSYRLHVRHVPLPILFFILWFHF